MKYTPRAGDNIRFKRTDRNRIYRVDQVILTDESQILGVAISTEIDAKRHRYLYDLFTFESFEPVKVTLWRNRSRLLSLTFTVPRAVHDP
jgi:hypothetical protein